MKCPDCADGFTDFALKDECQTCLGKGTVSSQFVSWRDKGDAIKEFRERRGWSFGDLAAALNVVAQRLQKPTTSEKEVEACEFGRKAPYKLLEYVVRFEVSETEEKKRRADAARNARATA